MFKNRIFQWIYRGPTVAICATDSLIIKKWYILLIRMKISLRKTKNIQATQL
jgi:hypothetical protein